MFGPMTPNRSLDVFHRFIKRDCEAPEMFSMLYWNVLGSLAEALTAQEDFD